MNGPTLFDALEPKTRGHDRPGAHGAAGAVRPYAKGCAYDILACLDEYGPLRAAQIAARYPSRNDGTVRSACSRLERQDAGLCWIEVVEYAQVGSFRPRREAVYAITTEGRRVLAATKEHA